MPQTEATNNNLQAQNTCTKLYTKGQSPINIKNLTYYLKFYPNRYDAKILEDGFKYGFRLNYSGQIFHTNIKNLKSANLHLNELKQKINKEVKLGHMVGPFDSAPLKNLKISPVGLIPKSDGSWRLITHLSYPPGNSVNDGIDKGLCSVNYTSFDKVSQMVFKLGKGALMAKRDIKSAFRLLPIHPNDFHLLGIRVDGKYYVDSMLPMGLSLSCALFEKFATFIHWLVSYVTGLHSLDHYLDDFIMAGEKDSENCQILVDTFSSLCDEVGVPIAENKSVGPTTVLVFLGLEIDSIAMTIRIPLHRIDELRKLLEAMLSKRKVTLQVLQTLVGKLSFFSRAIRSSRAFLRRFYDAMVPLKKPHHRLIINAELRQDLQLWLIFLEDYNGLSYIQDEVWLNSQCLQLFSDSCGTASLGCGCYFAGKWAFYQWPEKWCNQKILLDITFLEMVPVLLAIQLWGRELSRKRIVLYIDNEALVSVLNRQSSKSKRLMNLVRKFVLLSMQLEIVFKAVHISTKYNSIADSISRMQWTRFRKLAPMAVVNLEPIPLTFQKLLLEQKLSD